MEGYTYSSYPDSGDSSPRSREIECDNPSSWDDAPPAPAGKVKLMISYGGRIQPRPHDHQLSYVNGETKILSIDRSMRFAEFHAKLDSISGADEVCVKYQLPGEDLDALVSVVNDEDLDHMVLEFDRLHLQRSSSSTSSRASPRLRVFLFPINPPPPSAALLEPKPDRQWFVDVLNSVPQPPPPEPTFTVPTTALASGPTSPDYLFGLDNGFVPPPAVKVKDPAPEPQPRETPVEIPVKEERQISGDPSPVASPAELHRHIQELEKLQIAENQQQQTAPTMPRNGSDETLAMVYSPNNEYYHPKIQEKPPVPAPAPASPHPTAVPPPTVTAPAGYLSQLSVPGNMMSGRYTSIAGGDHPPFYLIPTAPPGYYTASPGAASYHAVYAMPPPPAPAAAGGQGTDAATTGYPAPVGYDSTGRAVYYTNVVPTYHQAVTSVALTNTESVKPVKPSQVS